MKNLLNTIFRKASIVLVALVAIGLIHGCDDEDLPTANSIADTTPPEANFSYASDASDFRLINFTNLSTEALNYSWDFGGGNTSDEQDPSFAFDDEGTYTVSLTATDGLGVSSTVSRDVVVEEGPYQPIVLEAGFEDNMLPDGTGDGRDSWRNSDLGGVIQITGSPVVSGDQGAKLTGSAADQRIGYQEIIVEPETNYDVNFIYTMLTTPVGFITVDILDVEANGGTFTSHEDAQNAVLGSITVNNQEDDQVYVPATVSFNSGTSSLIAIYFYNEGSVESRLDDFTIDIGREGAVPPSASFSAAQSEANFLEYAFTNSSVNADSYVWDFGDGNTSTEESPTHVYSIADVYTVTLMASSDGGLSAEFSTSIDIQDPVFAGFEYEVLAEDYLTYMFTDTSVNAASVQWDFGDGFLSNLESPSHTYAMDGIYTVTLTATSSTGLTSQATTDLIISRDFVPVILEASFEDGQLDGGSGDGRDSWRNSDLGGVIQITSSPVFSGSQAAKLTGDPADQRIGYQLIEVEASTDYDLSFYYTMKEAAGGFVTVAVLNGPVSNPDDVAGATIASITVNDQSDPDTYVGETLSFNSGSSTEIAIYFFNDGSVESRLDDFSIEKGEGSGAITPNIINGDFTSGQDDWKVSTFTGGTTSPFNSSSDGSWANYDGSNNGSKTAGAKWTQSTSAGEYKSADTRYAYQALTLTPNTAYILEYEYAIKDDDATDPTGGRRIVGEILDGHFEDGVNAAASSEAGNALVTHVGTIAEGKFSDTIGTKVRAEFTSNNSGQVSIWIWAVTPVDAYVDNVKVHPK